MSIIKNLCKEHTDLIDKEIEKIKHMAGTLQLVANMVDADVLIDCLTSNGDAIVVAEAKPAYVRSSYKASVVGLLAKKENEPAVARTFKLGIASKQMRAITQENKQVVQAVEPIHYNQHLIGVLVVEQKIDEGLKFPEKNFKFMADALAHMQDESNWLTEYIEEAIVLIDQEGIVTFRNSFAEKLYARLGFVDDILGVPYDTIRLTDYQLSGAEEDFSVKEAKIGKCYLSIKYVRLSTHGISFAVVISDITGIKEQEKELIFKSVAIKEMHHRIKNNLQTIASLLRLQVRRTNYEETRQVLGESMNRILSIAATHELLAQSGVDNVKIKGVILNIKNNTVRYFARPNFNVDVLLTGDDFEIESNLATTIALVINELLQNSLEYAFLGRERGRIRISVLKGELYSQIKVVDNGIGFDISSLNKSSLGLTIVKALVHDKLRGDINIQSGKEGTTVAFTFINNLLTGSDAM